MLLGLVLAPLTDKDANDAEEMRGIELPLSTADSPNEGCAVENILVAPVAERMQERRTPSQLNGKSPSSAPPPFQDSSVDTASKNGRPHLLHMSLLRLR
jgi:hypothetical protein